MGCSPPRLVSWFFLGGSGGEGGGGVVKFLYSDKHSQSFHMVSIPLGKNPNIKVKQSHSPAGWHLFLQIIVFH